MCTSLGLQDRGNALKISDYRDGAAQPRIELIFGSEGSHSAQDMRAKLQNSLKRLGLGDPLVSSSDSEGG